MKSRGHDSHLYPHLMHIYLLNMLNLPKFSLNLIRFTKTYLDLVIYLNHNLKLYPIVFPRLIINPRALARSWVHWFLLRFRTVSYIIKIEVFISSLFRYICVIEEYTIILLNSLFRSPLLVSCVFYMIQKGTISLFR